MMATRRWLRPLLWVGLVALGAVGATATIFLLDLEAPRASWIKTQLSLGRALEISGHFDVFLEGRALVYRRESCEPADTEARFFLHVVPVSVDDLPVSRKGFGFDNLDFHFEGQGDLADGSCTVSALLPPYPFERITTGQYDATGKLWSGTIEMPHSGKPVREDEIVFEPGATATLGTHLYTLEVDTVGLAPFATTGGAIEPIADRLLLATPRGRLATIDRDREVTYLEGGVPMNEAGFLAHRMQEDPAIAQATFRVMDILVRERADGLHDLFATHHFFNGRCVLFRLSATTLHVVDGNVEVSPTWRSIFDAKPCLVPPFFGNESGGRMLADGPDHLLVTVGHHGKDTAFPAGLRNRLAPDEERPPPSQDLALHLGKVLRVDVVAGQAEIHTLGHRNPQGLARDAEGNVWLTEHGAQGGDELNLIEPGGNYGWPEVSYGYQYPRMALKPDERGAGHHEGFVAPVFAWAPSISASAIIANNEAAFPMWRDDLLITSLWGRSHGYSLFRVRHQARQVRYVERIEIGHQIRDLAHAPDGDLALLLDIGRLLLVRRSDVWCDKVPAGYVHALHCDADAVAADGPAAPSPVATTAAPLSAEAREGQRLYGQHCGACHQLEEARYGLGPHLVGIMGRRAGTAAVDSAALAALNTVWDEDSLRRFILDPAGFAPGTVMPPSNLSEDEARVIVRHISERNAALATR